MGKTLRSCDQVIRPNLPRRGREGAMPAPVGESMGREIWMRAAVHGRKFFPVVLGRPAVTMPTRRAGISLIGLIGAGVEPPLYRLAVILVPDQPVQVDFTRAAFDAAFLQDCKLRCRCLLLSLTLECEI